MDDDQLEKTILNLHDQLNVLNKKRGDFERAILEKPVGPMQAIVDPQPIKGGIKFQVLGADIELIGRPVLRDGHLTRLEYECSYKWRGEDHIFYRQWIEAGRATIDLPLQGEGRQPYISDGALPFYFGIALANELLKTPLFKATSKGSGFFA